MEQAGEKRRGEAEIRKKLRVAVWHGYKKFRWCARVYPNGKAEWFYHSNLSSFGAVQSTLGVGGCGREIFASAKCQLQFAKASAATLPQQEKNDTEDLKRGRAHISDFIGTVAS